MPGGTAGTTEASWLRIGKRHIPCAELRAWKRIESPPLRGRTARLVHDFECNNRIDA